MDSIITVKTAQRAAQAARAAAKAAVVTVKAIAKATALAIKAIIAGTKALIAAIAAGGWVAVLVIIVICLIGMILGSVFGIFFSDEDSGTGMSMQTVVQEINTEYDTKLQEEKNSVSYDVLEMSGSRAVWKEVLAVYSVKTNTDQDNPQEVATMDDGKKQLLKDIFWEMNQISSRTESKTETVITETDDGHGNIVETDSTVTQTYLKKAYTPLSRSVEKTLPSATRLPRKWRRNMVLTKNRKATSLNCLQMKTITFGHRCFTALQAATDRS